ncbi:hypothetical protein IEI94_08945 [Halomonas sp. ML-15]|uniref:hypothetical protein n=1 Tax=Halomonas sp. ML-15 TaxID=2773305 RepID=UPI001747CCF4|nr:hypothetical protein [Halomonas sp. ML-15]MBD3895975.1 hypothetical protein [Halomonas sp. ML-15]
MATLPDQVLMDALEDLDDFATTLRALGMRLDALDPEAAGTTMRIAHELWELQKGLSDGRQVHFAT